MFRFLLKTGSMRPLYGVWRKGTTQRPVSAGVLILFFLMVAVPAPLYAYGDPTGGQLFQILAPLLAVIWGAWLIFANKVRKGVGNLFRWIRGSKASDSGANDLSVNGPGANGPGPSAD